LVSDYQGVGQSTSKTPTRNGLLRNAIATMEYAVKELNAEEIIKWGFSFGGAVDSHLNFNVPPGIKLVKVVDRTFASIESVVEAKTKSTFLSKLANSIDWHLDPVQGVWNNKAPMLLLYHKLDGTVPFQASLAAQFLAQRPPEVTLFELKGDNVNLTNGELAVSKRYHSRPYRWEELQFISNWIDNAFVSLSPPPAPAYDQHGIY
jgi:dienelactone hydrolase